MNALLDCPPSLQSQILVVAIAPGGYIYKETCGQLFHYRSEWWRDLVPRFDRDGVKRERDTTITLKSHPNAPFHDHTFRSPTYELKLREHITQYIQTEGKEI